LYFIENVQGGIFYPLAESDVFIVGFNFVGSVLERDSVSIAFRIYGALSNQNRMRLLIALVKKRLTDYELREQ
jgi:hypothetical protein